LTEALHALLVDPVARASQSECNEADARRFEVGPLMARLGESYQSLLSAG